MCNSLGSFKRLFPKGPHADGRLSSLFTENTVHEKTPDIQNAVQSGHKTTIHLDNLDKTEEKMADFTYFTSVVACRCLHIPS